MRTSRWPISHLPISDITPFTYRDGETYLELLNRLSQYITEQLHPNLRKTVEHMVEEMEHILAAQHNKYVEGIQDFQRIHDAFMEDVNSALMALNDNAVSDLVEDPGSDLGASLREIFIDRGLFDELEGVLTSNAERLEQQVLTGLEHVEVNVLNYGATGNGVDDDTAGIQAAVDHVSETYGGGVVHVPDGTYMIDTVDDGPYGPHRTHSDGGVQLRDNVTFKLSQNAVLKAFPTNNHTGNIVRVFMANNVIIEGGSYIGERDEHVGDDGEWLSNITIVGSTNVIIQNLHSSEAWGDGIYLTRGNNRKHSEHVTIRNVVLDRNRRQGVSVTESHHVTIEDSHILNTEGTNPSAGIDVEPNNGSSCSNVTIRNNTIDNNQYGVLIYGLHGPVFNIKVTGNTVLNSGREGILVRYSEDILIDGNYIQDPLFHSIELRSSQRVSIIGNITVRGDRPGVSIEDGRHCVVQGNRLYQPGYESSGHGVYLTESSHNTVNGNTVIESTQSGIFLGGSSQYNIVSGNNIQDAANNGVHMYAPSDSSGPRFNTVTGNTIRGSENSGVNIRNGHDTALSSNMITNSGVRHFNIGVAQRTHVTQNTCRSDGVKPVWAVELLSTASDTRVALNDFLGGSDGDVLDNGVNTTEIENRSNVG